MWLGGGSETSEGNLKGSGEVECGWRKREVSLWVLLPNDKSPGKLVPLSEDSGRSLYLAEVSCGS